jgi:hypothetical protein
MKQPGQRSDCPISSAICREQSGRAVAALIRNVGDVAAVDLFG